MYVCVSRPRNTTREEESFFAVCMGGEGVTMDIALFVAFL